MTVVGHILAIFLNFLPLLVILGLIALFLRWLNRHISFNFNGVDPQGKVVVWVLRPMIIIGAAFFILVFIAFSLEILTVIL